MGFGKRMKELLAVMAALLLAGGLAWYLLSGFGDRGYEKEGTLVEQEDGRLLCRNAERGERGGKQ